MGAYDNDTPAEYGVLVGHFNKVIRPGDGTHTIPNANFAKCARYP